MLNVGFRVVGFRPARIHGFQGLGGFMVSHA